MNKAELIGQFRKAGVREGMCLEVHSSLRSFGFVDGGADAVIDSLMACVTEQGSIFMPSLCLSPELPLTEGDKKLGITTKIKILPEDAPRTAMGIIPDTFRRREGVVTGSGVIRTSGWGLHGDQAAIGGLDYPIANGGKALLLGVDIYKLTAMHYVEYLLPPEIRDRFAPTEEAGREYPPDQWLIECGEFPVKPWYTIQNLARQKGVIQEGTIGKCHYMFFDIWDVVGLYKEMLERDPYRLYGLK